MINKRVREQYFTDNDHADDKATSEYTVRVTTFEKTRTGYIPIGPETGYAAKSNQDAYSVVYSFCGISGQVFIGVFDGHGFNGQKVSKFIKKRLPQNIKNRMTSEPQSFIDKIVSGRMADAKAHFPFQTQKILVNEQNAEHEVTNCFSENGKKSSMKFKILEDSFSQTQSDLKRQKFDIEFSGTTAVAVIVSPNGVLT